jgi:hypothetical protein
MVLLWLAARSFKFLCHAFLVGIFVLTASFLEELVISKDQRDSRQSLLLLYFIMLPYQTKLTRLRMLAFKKTLFDP